ncbi:MAG: hypothetical protein R3F35_20080 [Myxococcota bacterium]
MFRTSRCLVVLTLVLAWTFAVRADPFFRHEGARTPATEGWSPLGSGLQMTLGPVDDGGTAAWNVRDPSTASGSTLLYRQIPDAQQLASAAAQGWVLSTRLRVVNASATPDAIDFSVNVEYANGTSRYDLKFGAGANGANPAVQVGNGAIHTVSDPAGGYHRYDLVFDPAAGTAALFVDGAPTAITSYAGEAAGAAGTRVIWGGGQSAATGEASYALVEWGTPRDIDEDGIPDVRDDCPGVQNNPNVDTGGVGNGSGPDGIGDVCQCGDLGGNGRVDTGDALSIRQQLVDPDGAPLSPEAASLCNVIGGDAECDLADAIVIARRSTLASPPIEPICAAALGAGLVCGDGTCLAGRETCRFAGAGACQSDCGYCPNGTACSVAADCQTGYCHDGVCQSDPNALPGTCGDGVCDPTEGCGSAPPGCQPDCGACPVDQDWGDLTELERCTQDSDCPPPENVELLAKCEIYKTCGGFEDGKSCKDKYDCYGIPCLEVDGTGYCSGVQDRCLTDAGCRSPARCQGGFCLAGRQPVGMGCLTNDHCESDACNFGYCVEGVNPNGSPCTTDSACASGDCRFGLCVEVSCGNGECTAPAESCYSTGPLSCQADCGACPNGAPCALNADCASGICNFGFCIGACQGIGVPCTTVEACCSGTCDVGICTGYCGDGSCSIPLETCGSGNFNGLVCQLDCGKCPNGAPCDANADCASGICNFGFCIADEQPAGVPCTTDAACISGNCAGFCIQSCGDGSCDGTETCGSANPLSCSSDCGLCSLGTPCLGSSDCASGRCYAGFCVPSGCSGPFEGCDANNDCCGRPWSTALTCSNCVFSDCCVP